MSRILLDTHALLWWLADDRQLSWPAHDAISDPLNEPLVSIATLWEIAIKCSLRKLEVPDDLPEVIGRQGFAWLPITPDQAWSVRNLQFHHRDPFDRVLIAQALNERLAIVTADAKFEGYAVDLIW